jgi:hypothetical protein
MKTIVFFYVTGEPGKQSMSFNTRDEAVAFLAAMSLNPEIDACWIEKKLEEK